MYILLYVLLCVLYAFVVQKKLYVLHVVQKKHKWTLNIYKISMF